MILLPYVRSRGKLPSLLIVLCALAGPGYSLALAASGTTAGSADVPANEGVHLIDVAGLSLRDAIGIAISRHPDISRANAVVAQSVAEVAVAKAAWYPKIEYGVRPGYGGSFGSGGNSAGARGTIGVNQLLYDFGRTSSRISAADATLNEQQYKRADTVETVAYNTAATFIELAASQEVTAAAERQVEALRKTRARIVARVRAGLSVSSDRNLADVAIIRAKAEVLKANTRFDVAASRLAELTGVRPKRVAQLANTASYIRRLSHGDPNGDGADAVPQVNPDSVEQTPAVLAAGAAMEAADARVRLAEAERYPSIGVGVSRSLSTGRANASDDTWIGLSLTGNFSFGGLAKNRIAAAEAELRAKREALENQRLLTRTALQAAQTEAAGAAARLSSYERVISLWRTSRDLYWQEYMLNKRPLTEVINPERDIFLSEVEWINAVADGLLARVKAYVAVGQFIDLLRNEDGKPGASQ